MKIDDNVDVKLSEQAVNEIIREKGLKGKYFSKKVPYGYNYYDHSENTLDSYGVMHGTHVAGIVACKWRR